MSFKFESLDFQLVLSHALRKPCRSLQEIVTQLFSDMDKKTQIEILSAARTFIGKQIKTELTNLPDLIDRLRFCWTTLRQADITIRRIKEKEIPSPLRMRDLKTILKGLFPVAEFQDCLIQELCSLLQLEREAALITVPASFNTDQRTDTIAAAKLAGFVDIKLLDEPSAAFYYFFNQNRESGEFSTTKHVLVFDFGGGTLDVSIICIDEHDNDIILDAIRRSRYNNLGGDDIDLEIATFMLGCWEYELGEYVVTVQGAT